MKKFISIFLALAIVSALSVTAFAAEDEYAGTGESTVKAHIYSQYAITIPATIDLSEGTSGEVTINNANIEDGYSVNVYVTNNSTNGIVLTHSDGFSTIDCVITNIEAQTVANSTNPMVSFTKSSINEGTATKYFELQVQNIGTPGDYSGVLQYRFVCEKTD